VCIIIAPTAAPNETTAAPAETLIPALARPFLVTFALEPIAVVLRGQSLLDRCHQRGLQRVHHDCADGRAE
jgi:hypothetical protein